MCKYKCIILFILITIILFVGYNNVFAYNSLNGKIIYIDPGHGGVDPGCIYKNIYEKDINLKISKDLKEKLEKKGAKVYLTRSDDYDLSVTNTINRKRSDLSRRVNVINESNADLYLSIHLNAEKTNTWKGPQIFYDDINPENKNIASILQKNLNKIFYTKRFSKEVNDLYLEKKVKIKGVLIEVGFLSNSNDRYLLTNSKFVNKISNSITNSIIEYFS